jgi:regulator of sigma E protease
VELTTAGFFDTGLLFIIVLGALIFVHELGHFLFAKRAGVRVERFSLGFGAPLWRKQWGETEYRLSAIPLGGYVKMYGENPEEEVGAPERSFLHQSVWTRIPIVVAGPLFNFLFAILLIACLHVIGLPVEKSVQIGRVFPDSAAGVAGLQTGDVIEALGTQPIEQIHQLKEHIVASEGRTLKLHVRREHRTMIIPITPQQDAASGEWRIGVELRPGTIVIQRSNPFQAVGQGIAWTWRLTQMSFIGFGKILSGTIPASEGLAGPIGIAREIGRAADYGWRNVVFFTAAISISLAILNLLPIPVLDGGHLLFFAIEIVNGGPLSLRKREIANQVGFFLLLSLMIFAFYNDIMKLFFRK